MRRDSHGSLNPACRALLAVVAALAVVPAATGMPPCPESRPMVPLVAGTRWVYRGMVVSTVIDEDHVHVIRGVHRWSMDVRKVEHEGDATVAVVEGFPGELDWYQPGVQKRNKFVVVAREHHGFHMVDDLDACQFATWRQSCLGRWNVQYMPFMLPGILKVGRAFGGDENAHLRPDKWYQWHIEDVRCVQLRGVAGLDPGRLWRQYRVAYRTIPGHVLIYFVPGLGITRYVYDHHGTPASTDVRLIAIRHKVVSDRKVGVARRAPR